MNRTPLLKLEDVWFSYTRVPVLKAVNLCIHHNDIITITGPNGGGKTTLLKIIAGLLPPDRGSSQLQGNHTASPFGYVPQYSVFDPRYPIKVHEVVEMGCLRGPLLRKNSQTRALTDQALKQVGLSNYRNASFSELSGGQRQRILIARALSGSPEILLLDEPTASIDIESEQRLYALLESLVGKMTILLITHDPLFVSKITTRVLCVNKEVREHPVQKVDRSLADNLPPGKERIVQHEINLEHHHKGETNVVS